MSHFFAVSGQREKEHHLSYGDETLVYFNKMIKLKFQAIFCPTNPDEMTHGRSQHVATFTSLSVDWAPDLCPFPGAS